MALLAPDQTTKHRHFVWSKVLIPCCVGARPFPIVYFQGPALRGRERLSADSEAHDLAAANIGPRRSGAGKVTTRAKCSKFVGEGRSRFADRVILRKNDCA